ncbi:hypothetical protein [Desulfonema ishimotonii]|uniref:hypothetical protein n=1 Tax=Desulfonema ishimotonii TaxID=45657 RepID=UPI000F573A79|nr:hypothetical protein [Desulfonema ishimotonii]
MPNQNEHKRLKKILFIGALYIGASLSILIRSDDDGTIFNWKFQAIIGPLWHLSAFIEVVQRPFEYLDGVPRVTGEDILMALMTIFIWLVGGLLIFWYFLTSKNRKRIILSILLGYWLIVAYYNIYLYGLFTI